MYVEFCLRLVFLLFTCVSFCGVFKLRPFPLSLLDCLCCPLVFHDLLYLSGLQFFDFGFCQFPIYLSLNVFIYYIYFYLCCFWINFFLRTLAPFPPIALWPCLHLPLYHYCFESSDLYFVINYGTVPGKPVIKYSVAPSG